MSVLDEFSPFRYYLNRIRSGSGKKHGGTDLTLDDLKRLWDDQDGLCALSGVQMDLPRMKTDSHGFPTCASLDRIDSDRGYVLDNVQFVCNFVNMGKGPNSDEEAIEFIEKVRQVKG